MKNYLGRIISLACILLTQGCDLMVRSPKFPDAREKLELVCSKEPDYFYINGVNTDPDYAEETRKDMQSAFRKNFRKIFNDAQGFRILLAGLNINSMNDDNSYDLIERIQKILSENLLSISPEDVYTQEDVRQMGQAIASFKLGKKPVIVSHSYGNVFAHKICNDTSDGAKLIHLANPTSPTTTTKCSAVTMSFEKDFLLTGLELAGWPVHPRTHKYKGPKIDPGNGVDKVVDAVFGYHGVNYFLFDPSTKELISKNLAPSKNASAESLTLFVHSGSKHKSSFKLCSGNKCQEEWKVSCKEESKYPVIYALPINNRQWGAVRYGKSVSTIVDSDRSSSWRGLKVNREVVKGEDLLIISNPSKLEIVNSTLNTIYENLMKKYFGKQ